MSLSEAVLLRDVRDRLFAPVTSAKPRTIGLELELIPLLRSTREPALASRSARPSTSAVISRLAAGEGWVEQAAADDPPSWTMNDGTRISFEPGGQIEISSAPHESASRVVESMQGLATRLREAMAEEGIELVARGVDPYNDIANAPLQLHRERYTNMTRYFDGIGPSGRRMMRQTAALQMNVERGEDPGARWRLLNALAPIVVALFANSRQYANARTEWASYRARLWQMLDPSRTGIAFGKEDHAAHYLRFALDAGAMRAGGGDRRCAFREWMTEPAVDMDEWIFHLSTLFPEVRPKEFFELRSADTIEPDSLAAPVVFVAGLVYDDRSARAATDILGLPDGNLLERAGHFGLADASLHRLASEVTECAIDGARRLGGGYLAPAHIEIASRYFARALTERDI